MRILNLTQHAATAEQIAAGVIEPADKALVQKLLTFDELPDSEDIWFRAQGLAGLLCGDNGPEYEAAMIGGAPFFMAPLEKILREYGVQPLYAFSKRESVEEKQADGGIKKTQIFRHAGFVST